MSSKGTETGDKEILLCGYTVSVAPPLDFDLQHRRCRTRRGVTRMAYFYSKVTAYHNN